MKAAPRKSVSTARGLHGASRPVPEAVARPKFEGRTLGGFRLAREIASGGMAAVYLGHRIQHARIAQVAAVKVIHPHLARDREFVEMFLDEARIASCVTHPNVCRVLDFGQSDGTYYLAMEYVMGETLADVLTRLGTAAEADRIGVALLTQILIQACEGVHAAHEARDPQGKPLNIVHRDISPQNIMVGYDGGVRVLDFGVASASDRLHATQNGKVKGRVAYMAPEQMRGQQLDRRADLWSLGVVLWEGLAGKRLFKREDEVKTIVAVTHDPVPLLSECGRPVPVALQRIVERTLTRDPESRYATARDLGLALSRSAAKLLPHAGMPETSVWMQSLFGENIERKRALLCEAADAAEASAGRGALTLRLDDEGTGVDEGTAETLHAVPSLRLRQPSSRSTIRPLTRRRSRKRGLLLLVTMLLLGIPAPCSAPGSDSTSEHASLPAEPPLHPSGAEASEMPGPGAIVRRLALAAQHAASDALKPAPALAAQPAAQDEAIPEPTPAAQDAVPDVLVPTPALAAQPAVEGEDNPESAVAAQPALDDVLNPPPALVVQPVADDEATAIPAASPSAEPSAAQDLQATPESAVRKERIGEVNVVAAGGWADVYLGARKLGTTPLRTSLPAGVRFLRLHPFGKGPGFVRRVAVSDGQPVLLSVAIR